MLFWTSSAIALYYLVLTAFAIYRHHDSLIGGLLGLAVACWLIGWLIQRPTRPEGDDDVSDLNTRPGRREAALRHSRHNRASQK